MHLYSYVAEGTMLMNPACHLISSYTKNFATVVFVYLVTIITLSLIFEKQARAVNKMRPSGFSLMETYMQTDGHTDIRTYGRTHLHKEMRGRI